MRTTTNRELWLSVLAMLLIGIIYAIVVLQTKTIPAAAGLFGHLLGIVGFLMMLMTEILYSLRKRSHLAHWGRMTDWLQFHIFTGLVGPFMVLLHTSWKFNGRFSSW
jgi:xanthosine utilization system XapX-like protein